MTNTQKLGNAAINTIAHGVVWLVPIFFLAYPEAGKLTISVLGSMIVAFVNAHYLSS